MNQRPFADDDVAVLQVLESIMAAMILMGAILFVTVTSSPVRDSGAPGVNLGTIAEDTLGVLQNQPSSYDDNITRLEEIVDLAISGQDNNAEGFLASVVPQGTRYALRLDNGYGSLQLVPAGNATTTPREASGASTYIMPNWTVSLVTSTQYLPGDELDFSGWTSLKGPDGSDTGPGGEAWLDIWTEEVPDQDRVPISAPYGEWDCSNCLGDFRVWGINGTITDRPLYSVELLLWEGV